MNYKYLFLVFIFILLGCIKNNRNELEQSKESQIIITEDVVFPSSQAEYFDRELIAKAVISSIMGRPLKNVKSKKQNEIYFVSYVRQEDNQSFSYKVKIEGNRIIWGSPDGRWMDHRLDEKITFIETKEHLKIRETYSDGSFSNYEFTSKDFE